MVFSSDFPEYSLCSHAVFFSCPLYLFLPFILSLFLFSPLILYLPSLLGSLSFLPLLLSFYLVSLSIWYWNNL